MGNKTGKLVDCCTCGKSFYRAKWQLKERNFCSRGCSNAGHSLLLTKTTYSKVNCPECGKEFQQHWKGPKKFCSTKCSSLHKLGVINAREPKKSGTKPEKEFAKLLRKYKIKFIFQHPVAWKKGWKKWYDFYLPNHNLLVEIDGTYWHGKGISTKELNKQQWKTRVNDRLKNYLAKERGFILKRIWSDEINLLSYIKLKKILHEDKNMRN